MVTAAGSSDTGTVEVSVTTDPGGRWAVLLQLPYGWVTLLPGDALKVADVLSQAATHAELLTEGDG